MQNKKVFMDTCLLGFGKMNQIPVYARRYGERLGFEVLAMFDLPHFEAELRQQAEALSRHEITFHGPVFGVEHSAPRGSKAWEESMYHIRKTEEFARLLGSRSLVMHLNNCRVAEGEKDRMLRCALESYRELQDIFGAFGCEIQVENTGTVLDGNMLLDQGEFTDLCRREGFSVVVDIGHANANGWDLFRLIDDLSAQIRTYHLHNNDGRHDSHSRIRNGTLDFDRVLGHILRATPEANLVVEYTRPSLEGEALREDLEYVMKRLDGEE